MHPTISNFLDNVLTISQLLGTDHRDSVLILPGLSFFPPASYNRSRQTSERSHTSFYLSSIISAS
jgi:hypothetical protein